MISNVEVKATPKLIRQHVKDKRTQKMICAKGHKMDVLSTALLFRRSFSVGRNDGGIAGSCRYCGFVWNRSLFCLNVHPFFV